MKITHIDLDLRQGEDQEKGIKLSTRPQEAMDLTQQISLSSTGVIGIGKGSSSSAFHLDFA